MWTWSRALWVGHLFIMRYSPDMQMLLDASLLTRRTSMQEQVSRFRLQGRYGMVCIFRIRWSLLGSYVCFTTTSLVTVDTPLLLRLSTTCQYQTTATGWEWMLQLELCWVHQPCTVQSLKYVPVASIFGWWLREPDWGSVSDLWWGS